MGTSAAPLEWLLRPPAGDNGFDRKALAGLLLELARNVDANVGAQPTGIIPFDPRLEQLRFLLLGREIELSKHFSRVLDDPEQLALTISRVLPAAIAQAAARDERLGQVLAPALGSSVRRDPGTLIDIIHPLIGPAIGKSIDARYSPLVETYAVAVARNDRKNPGDSVRKAIAWTEQTPDTEERHKALVQIGVLYLHHEPETARRWLAEHGLEDEVRAETARYQRQLQGS